MAFTRTQARAWATGTTAALKRQSERWETVLKVTHDDLYRPEQIRRVIEVFLIQRGMLPEATTRVEIVDQDTVASLREQLEEQKAVVQKQKAVIEQADETIRRKDEEIAALRAAPKPPLLELVPKPKETRWGSIRQAAELHGVADPTLRRACKEGRIRCKRERINKYDRYLVDLDAPLIRLTRKRK